MDFRCASVACDEVIHKKPAREPAVVRLGF